MGPFELIGYESQYASKRELRAATTRDPRARFLRGGVEQRGPCNRFE
jgi:hypothetical protein